MKWGFVFGMPELNPSLLKGESRENAQFQTELQCIRTGLLHLQEACEDKKHHSDRWSWAPKGRPPGLSLRWATPVTSLRDKMLQGLHELWNHLMLVVHVLYPWITGLSRKKTMFISIVDRETGKKHEVGMRKPCPNPVVPVTKSCFSREDTSPLSGSAPLC